jgi:hypothetical protein
MDFAICAVCFGERWLCTAHPEQPWPHADCAAPGMPCPQCNAGELPEFGPDSVSLTEVDEDDE